LATRRLKHKILAAVGLSVAAGILALAWYSTARQERAILEQNEHTVQKLTESVTSAMQSVMLAGYAHIAQGYAERLKQVPGVVDFRILRTDGVEAFRDNSTIAAVNRRRGEEQFVPRPSEESVRVLAAEHPGLRQVRERPGGGLVSYADADPQGGAARTYLDGIPNLNVCHRCHGGGEPLRGAIKLTMSLVPVQNEILKTREQTLLGAALALVLVLALTGYMMGRAVLRPIAQVTSAMERAAGGDLAQKVPVVSQDEIGQMARSFNTMTDELKRSYEGLKLEQDKLTTIIQSAGEGMVVTDRHGEVVLVNPAAERLLGKTVDEIVRGGFLGLLGRPEVMVACLKLGVVSEPDPLLHNGRLLAVCAATIRTGAGEPIGSAALIRDVTEQKRLEEELRRHSVTDGLTELYNRRYMDEVLASEFSRARRYRSGLSLLMLDIDHFKRFNDAHGHGMGDRVLRAVARTLKGALRNHDVPCRYGGEEFVAILPQTGRAGAFAVAERLRRDVEEIDLEGLGVTVSIGVASYPELEMDRPERLVQAADVALYEAKNAGRNRVRVNEGPEQAPAG
jgi:diguanylate cyclase (GGDEF)-like protein